MPNLHVKKTKELRGTIRAPPSKTYTHRAVIVASLSDGRSVIKEPSNCDDALATIRACSTLGAKIRRKRHPSLVIDGMPKPKAPKDIIDCSGSGSTIRFLLSICALADGISILTGNISLRKRPMQPLLDALDQLGVQCVSTNSDGTAPIIVYGGGIKGGEVSLVGDISSQFISSLLIGVPKARNETRLVVTTPVESRPYVAMTLEILRKHGARIDFSSSLDRFLVPCGQQYRPCDHLIEGDYSSASFVLAASVLTKSRVRVMNLRKETLQGDRIMTDILRKMGASVNLGEDYVEVIGAPGGLTGLNMDLHDAPDLVPICAVLACFAHGETVIKGVRRLRFKESDRIASLITELAKMGGKLEDAQDSLRIDGKGKLKGARIDSHDDHRIAMACAVAALGAEGETIIRGKQCIKKSYPEFEENLRFLGGKVVGG